MSKWEMVKLGDVCNINMGQSPSSDSYNEQNDGIPFYQGNADFGPLHPEVRYYCNKPTKIADRYDVLLSVRAPIGALNIATEKCCIGRGLCAITQRENISYYKYLYYILKMKNSELNAKGTGSTFKAINKANLLDIEIPLPPLDVQKHIADILDKTQEIIDGRNKWLKELDNLIKSILYDMFRDSERNGNGWKRLLWNDVFSTTTGKLDSNAMCDNGQYPFFTCAKEIYKIDKYAFDCEALLLAGNNATANYDVKYYKGKFNAYQRTYVISLKDDNNEYRLFQYLLEEKLKFMQANSKGTNTKYLTMGILGKMDFIIPPKELQHKFANIVINIEEQKSIVKQSLKESQNLFNSLMSKYFD